jgi:hypothetical protein
LLTGQSALFTSRIPALAVQRLVQAMIEVPVHLQNEALAAALQLLVSAPCLVVARAHA